MKFILTDGRAWYKQIITGIFNAMGVIIFGIFGLGFSVILGTAAMNFGVVKLFYTGLIGITITFLIIGVFFCADRLISWALK
jgi:uncharacterized membrane protein YagU involved in acid resistance